MCDIFQVAENGEKNSAGFPDSDNAARDNSRGPDVRNTIILDQHIFVFRFARILFFHLS